ncbi:hypothetical protein GGF32_003580 [Allomyces javanicus]|nr:hypothetical protein GGF32_003580 [Allomyces javanicus]
MASNDCTGRDLRSWSDSISAAINEYTQPDEGDGDHCSPKWMQIREDMERAIRLGLLAAVAHGDMDLAVELVLAGRSSRVSDPHVEAVAQMMQLTDTLREMDPRTDLPATAQLWPTRIKLAASMIGQVATQSI